MTERTGWLFHRVPEHRSSSSISFACYKITELRDATEGTDDCSKTGEKDVSRKADRGT
jgi:hypothetical protein